MLPLLNCKNDVPKIIGTTLSDEEVSDCAKEFEKNNTFIFSCSSWIGSGSRLILKWFFYHWSDALWIYTSFIPLLKKDKWSFSFGLAYWQAWWFWIRIRTGVLCYLSGKTITTLLSKNWKNLETNGISSYSPHRKGWQPPHWQSMTPQLFSVTSS